MIEADHFDGHDETEQRCPYRVRHSAVECWITSPPASQANAPRKLVSILTPTWNRPDLLIEMMANVRAQTYRPLEHVVVSDGLDGGLRMRVSYDAMSHTGGPCFVPVRFVELGRNWSSFLPNSFCAAPNVVGQLVARGEYQCTWADDERADSEHIEKMVDLLESSGADFVYPKVRMYRPGQRPEDGFTIGTDPPQLGQITHWLYRADLLKRGLYPFGAGMTSDWACISQWINAGATWAFLTEVTFDHRIDH